MALTPAPILQDRPTRARRLLPTLAVRVREDLALPLRLPLPVPIAPGALPAPPTPPTAAAPPPATPSAPPAAATAAPAPPGVELPAGLPGGLPDLGLRLALQDGPLHLDPKGSLWTLRVGKERRQTAVSLMVSASSVETASQARRASPASPANITSASVSPCWYLWR